MPLTRSVFKSTRATSLAPRLASAAALTVRALLGAGSQQQLGHGHVVGHDGDVEGQQALAVGGVEVQLLQTVLGQEQLHQVQLLVLHGLKQGFATLELRQKDVAEASDSSLWRRMEDVSLFIFKMTLRGWYIGCRQSKLFAILFEE